MKRIIVILLFSMCFAGNNSSVQAAAYIHIGSSELPNAYGFLNSHSDNGYFTNPKTKETYSDTKWALPYTIEAVRYGIYNTYVTYDFKGTDLPARPITFDDVGLSNGSTPYGHPGGAHNGGINFDMGYFMTKTDSEWPFPMVCPQTDAYNRSYNEDISSFIKATRNVGYGTHCNGEPVFLDDTHTAFFVASLAQLDLQLNGALFGQTNGGFPRSGISGAIAMDKWIWAAVQGYKVDADGDPVLERSNGRNYNVLNNSQGFNCLLANGWFTKDVIDHARNIIFTSQPTGEGSWGSFHHHHMHIRFIGTHDNKNTNLYNKIRTQNTDLISQFQSGNSPKTSSIQSNSNPIKEPVVDNDKAPTFGVAFKRIIFKTGYRIKNFGH